MKTKVLFYLPWILGAAYLGFWVRAWYVPPPTRTLSRVPVAPYVAAGSDIARGVGLGVVPREIVVLRPTEEQKAKIEKKVGGELPKGDVTSIVQIDRLPYGGKGIIFLEPVTVDGKEVTQTKIKIYPTKQPFFEWINSRELGVYYGIGGSLQGAMLSLEYRHDLFRTGPAIWNVKVGVTQSPAMTTGYGMVGVSVKF